MLQASAWLLLQSRPEIHHLVPQHAQSLLDVGCGEGAFGTALRDARPELKVWGVEMNANAAAVAATHYDEVIVGPFPDAAVDIGVTFDCIAFNDVLEHMLDPWSALARSKDFLAEGGVVIVSLPNVASFGIISQLIRGEFTYTESGVLDRTHLRFFTLKTASAMAEDAGYVVRSVSHSWPYVGRWVARLLDRLKVGRLNWRQIILVLETR